MPMGAGTYTIAFARVAGKVSVCPANLHEATRHEGGFIVPLATAQCHTGGHSSAKLDSTLDLSNCCVVGVLNDNLQVRRGEWRLGALALSHRVAAHIPRSHCPVPPAKRRCPSEARGVHPSCPQA